MKEIPIVKLKPFDGHPYKVIDNDEMDELVDSIREHGMLIPLIVRRVGDGYEIISGHRRAHAAELAGLTTVPVIEKELSRDEAAVMLVDSNLHREHILPSEKAFEYKLKAEALEHQGKSLTSGQLVPKSDGSRTTAIIGAQTGESYKTVQRYIRLTYLLPALLDMVDSERIAFSVGVELSFLDPELQAALITSIEVNDCTPSYAQANHMHKAAVAGELDEEMLLAIMEEEKAERSVLEEELRKVRQRLELVGTLYEKLYEDNATGKVTDEWYSHMSLKYETERIELKVKIEDLDKKLKALRTAEKNNEYFIRAVRRFMDMDTLTAPLLKELIDRIEVSEVQGKGKNRSQRIVIHYRFAGYLDLEENYLERNIVQGTRRGVAVEYVPHAAGE